MRGMSEKPQAIREKEQEDLLEQIIAQGLEKIKASSPAESEPKPFGSEVPPAPEQSGGDHPPPDSKHRRSAVYLYLLVLFGAAFLMLLLAYFVQQRNSEDAINDLRNSMNLSRQDLLVEVKELKDQNAALEEINNALARELARLNDELALWQTRYGEMEQEAAALRESYYFASTEANSWASFWELEQFYRAENLKGCAAVLLKQALSQPAYNGLSQYTYRTPDGMDRRYEEIVRAVVGAGILDWDYEQHLADYMELLNG